MKSCKVGIQGVRACFHDVAARAYFSESIEPVECASFKSLCLTLDRKEVDVCMMAIENSIASSILPNYSLLKNHDFCILGEIYLRIEMCLLALPGQQLSEIKFVQSHPMALAQCDEFLSGFPGMKILEAADTAESAKHIGDKGLRGYAAIASRLAAQTYGLELLREGIESNRQNYTRFLAICRREDYLVPEGANKATLCFESPDEPGSLSAILGIFSRHAINLTKIQSVPVLGKPYKYSFHVDIEWNDRAQYLAALAELPDMALNLVQFGEYRCGDRPWL
ncbi:MAG: prephenate dehydratase [Candidatus Riflebacteria bacterium]|nr:prephenate dehydratase [Candidatus Riflebacteria bacterium]